MKKIMLDFLRRGVVACGFGPVVLAIIYTILYRCSVIDTLTVDQVCVGVFSITGLAFLAGGMNAIYQIERLPLMTAILIHGVILYLGYLGTYLTNGWLKLGMTPILIFSAIFVFGYLVIWIIIYTINKRNTAKLNRALMQKGKIE